MRNRDISKSMNMAVESADSSNVQIGNPMLGPSLGQVLAAANPTPITMSETIGEISLALSKAQGDLESAKKGTEGYGYNYSDLASVISAAKEVLTKNELAIVQLVGNEGDKYKVTTILSHKSGEFFKSEVSSGLVDMKGTNELQKAGGTISYLRRYAYQAILGMASEDNDGSSNGFSKPGKAAPKKAASSAPKRFDRKAAKTTKTEDEDDI